MLCIAGPVRVRMQQAWLQEEQQGFRSTTSKGGASPVWQVTRLTAALYVHGI